MVARYLCVVQTTKVQTVLLLGSNAPEALSWLQKGLDGLRSTGTVLSISGVYASPSWGFDGPDFKNAAVLLETDAAPAAMLQQILALETALGRVRNPSGPRYTDRTLDIDILLWGKEVIQTPELQVPHPRLCDRLFALIPLQQVLPDWIHPETGADLGTILACCNDENFVTLTPEKLI